MPLVIIPVVLHHLRLITSDAFLVVILGAGLVALLAVLTSLIALARLWQSGDQGWGRSLLGLLFGVLCLVPFGWFGYPLLEYPPVTDIATTSRSALPLVFDPGLQTMPAPRMLSADQMAEIFPNVETRKYPLGIVPTFALVQQLVASDGWDVRRVREPTAALDAGLLNAQVVTLPGWREEVVIRVAGTLDESTVDMRSASLNAQHDLGSNGQRIEAFLAALDEAVTILLRDNPNANQPIEDEPEPAPVATD